MSRARLGVMPVIFDWSGISVASLGFVATVVVSASRGGYFPETWAWIALLTFVPAALILILGGGARLGRLDLAFLGLLLAFGCWTLLSATWSASTTSAVLEAQRILAYLGVLLLTLLVVQQEDGAGAARRLPRRRDARGGYALLTRLLPDGFATFGSISGYRLSDPVGYWNGLGIYSAMGALLAVGFLARARSVAARTAAAALPVVLLVTALYFTFSRGSWIGARRGPRRGGRIRPRPAAAARRHARRRPLVCARGVARVALRRAHDARLHARRRTRTGARAAAGRRGAHPRLGPAAGLALALVDRGVVVSTRTRRVFAGVLVVVALGRRRAARGDARALRSRSPTRPGRSSAIPRQRSSADLNSRLFDLSSNGRLCTGASPGTTSRRTRSSERERAPTQPRGRSVARRRSRC